MMIGKLHGPFFKYLDRLWGPFTIDRFADQSNNKLTRFNLNFLCPNTEGVDAFCVPWDKENNYLVPPITAVCKVLQHMEFYQASGVLVVPFWTSSPFWVFIAKSPMNFIPL